MAGWDKHARVLLTSLAFGVLGASCAREAAKEEVKQPDEAEAAIASEIVGLATISDGDTIHVGPRHIRFDGIETPRPRAMCGEVNAYREATDALRSVLRSQEVRCAISDLPDAQGRDIARCTAGETDLNEYMVSSGWARDVPAHSHGAYADEEAAAREAHRGVWGLTCSSDPWPQD
jgi:endonuclease YncB( thermonuclease family)